MGLYGFMGFLWISYGFPMVSYGCPTRFPSGLAWARRANGNWSGAPRWLVAGSGRRFGCHGYERDFDLKKTIAQTRPRSGMLDDYKIKMKFTSWMKPYGHWLINHRSPTSAKRILSVRSRTAATGLH